jgi:hypothetical protein
LVKTHNSLRNEFDLGWHDMPALGSARLMHLEHRIGAPAMHPQGAGHPFGLVSPPRDQGARSGCAGMMPKLASRALKPICML